MKPAATSAIPLRGHSREQPYRAERPVSSQRLRLPTGLQGDPAWEAMKASRRPLSHGQAVAECARLSNQYRQMWRRMAGITVDLSAILLTLRAKKIPFVLTGAHG